MIDETLLEPEIVIVVCGVSVGMGVAVGGVGEQAAANSKPTQAITINGDEVSVVNENVVTAYRDFSRDDSDIDNVVLERTNLD